MKIGKTELISFMTLTAFLFFSNFLNAQLSVTTSETNPTCNNFTDGRATATATGGTAPYRYEWSNGQIGSDLLGVGGGTYTVNVTDADSNSGSATVTITNPAAVVASATLTGNPCTNPGDASASASGGVGNYSYSWSNGATTANVSGLSQGTQCVTITDSNGCAAVACVNVAAPLTLDVATIDSQCGGVCDGSAAANVSGGTGPYTYLWNTGATTGVIAPIPKGTYDVTVTDANGCVITGTGIVDEPSPVVISVNTVQPSCAGAVGSISITSTGGVTPYTYLWNTGATTPSISNLGPGTYIAIITDANLCAKDTSITLTGGGLGVTGTSSDVSCGATNDGAASVFATGGTPPFSYSWSNGQTGNSISNLTAGSYTVTVSDSGGCSTTYTAVINNGAGGFNVTSSSMDISCNGARDGSASVIASGGSGNFSYAWGNGATTATVTGLDAGTATVNVTDNDLGCFETVAFNIAEPSAVSVSGTASDETCLGANDGSATASATGGTAPYSYTWSNGMTGAMINNLTPGTYTVTAEDANGCTSAMSTVSIAAGTSSLSVSASGMNISCNGAADGSATAVATGSGNATYSWSNGMTGATINNLTAGIYTVTVMDGTCTGTATITINEPSAINISATVMDEACPNANNGSANASATGGAGTFTYNWSNGMFGASISNLAPGSYTVTATDNTGCTNTATVQVASGTGPSVSVTSTNVMCLGDDDGSATATGGGAGATYMWSNGATTRVINNLGAGTYSVTVTDGAGCTDTGSTTITAPSSAISASAMITSPISVAGANDGEAMAVGTGGTPGYTYLWSNGATTKNITNLSPGTYEVTITDSNGCSAVAVVSLVDGATPCDPFTDPGTVVGKQTACGPGYDPTVLSEGVAPTGGSGRIEYLWMSSTDSPDFTGGTYTAIPGATGATYDPGPIYVTTYYTRCVRREGCTYIEPTPICVIIENPDLAGITSDDMFCPNQSITFTANDAGPLAKYTWDFGSTATPKTGSSRTMTVTFNGNNPGPRINLTVETDGCTSSATKKITTDPNCPPSIVFRTSVSKGNFVKTEWSILMDDAEYSYEVMESHDGVNFKPLHEMTAKGQMNTDNTFSYLDESPKKGHSTYKVIGTRLSDGKTVVSNTSDVRITWGADNSFVYPNPSQDVFMVERLESFESAGTVEVLNSKGQIVSMYDLNVNEVRKEIQISKMNSGVYFIRVTYQNGTEPEIHRFVKR